MNTIERGSQEHYDLMARTIDLMQELSFELFERASVWSKKGDYALMAKCKLHAMRHICALNLHDSL